MTTTKRTGRPAAAPSQKAPGASAPHLVPFYPTGGLDPDFALPKRGAARPGVWGRLLSGLRTGRSH